MNRILLIILAAAVCVGADARRVPAKKKAASYTKIVPAVQPVPADSFSYAMGVAQTPSLKQYLAQQEGIEEGQYGLFVKGLTTMLTKEEEDAAIAYAAGIKIARMNRERVIPNISKQFGGNDSTYLQADRYLQGLSESIEGHSVMQDSVAMSLVERQQNYRMEVMKCEGLNWLGENGQKPGIKTLPSGLQYEVVTAGNGAIPTDTCEVEVNYEGKLIDGTVFDSSYKRGKPATFGVTQVIKGWTEALKLMPVGSTWNLYIPYDLAYGEQGSRNIPPYSTLIFKVELLGIKDKAGK